MSKGRHGVDHRDPGKPTMLILVTQENQEASHQRISSVETFFSFFHPTRLQFQPVSYKLEWETVCMYKIAVGAVIWNGNYGVVLLLRMQNKQKKRGKPSKCQNVQFFSTAYITEKMIM